LFRARLWCPAVFLGNIHPLVGSWTSWCVVRAFGGDFGTVANYARKKFSAPIHPHSGHRFRSFICQRKKVGKASQQGPKSPYWEEGGLVVLAIKI
jgi:hypothetical protein